MAIRSFKNRYRGVNAHLHSLMQGADSTWLAFHALYVGDIARAIARVLIPLGYEVELETGLQIKQISEMGRPGDEQTQLRRPDVVIMHNPADKVKVSPAPASPALPISVPTSTVLIADTEGDRTSEDYFMAVVITKGAERRQVITWLELLSPSNKQVSSGRRDYRNKRIQTLRASVALVEIDLLHESTSPLAALPIYARGDTGAFPYMISVSDPRPTYETGITAVYGFGVDEPIPTIAIPLAGEDSFEFDFNSVYQQTFESFVTFGRLVDYGQEPQRMETYAPEDRARIRARMAATAEYARSTPDAFFGVDVATLAP